MHNFENLGIRLNLATPVGYSPLFSYAVCFFSQQWLGIRLHKDNVGRWYSLVFKLQTPYLRVVVHMVTGHVECGDSPQKFKIPTWPPGVSETTVLGWKWTSSAAASLSCWNWRQQEPWEGKSSVQESRPSPVFTAHAQMSFLDQSWSVSFESFGSTVDPVVVEPYRCVRAFSKKLPLHVNAQRFPHWLLTSFTAFDPTIALKLVIFHWILTW